MKRSLLIIWLALIFLTLLWACGRQNTSSRGLSFHCEGGQGFRVEYDETTKSVLLKMDGQNIKLTQVASASGAKYSDGATTLWMKGTEAFIEKDGKILMKNCRVTR